MVAFSSVSVDNPKNVLARLRARNGTLVINSLVSFAGNRRGIDKAMGHTLVDVSHDIAKSFEAHHSTLESITSSDVGTTFSKGRGFLSDAR